MNKSKWLDSTKDCRYSGKCCIYLGPTDMVLQDLQDLVWLVQQAYNPKLRVTMFDLWPNQYHHMTFMVAHWILLTWLFQKLQNLSTSDCYFEAISIAHPRGLFRPCCYQTNFKTCCIHKSKHKTNWTGTACTVKDLVWKWVLLGNVFFL